MDSLRKILFRVDGNSKIGMGHIIRCVDIAKLLRIRGFHITFLFKHENILINIMKDENFEFYTINNGLKNLTSEIKEIELNPKLLGKNFDIIILDLLIGFQKDAYIKFFKKFSRKVIVFSDATSKIDTTADIVFLFSQSQRKEWYINKKLKNQKYYIGLNYFPLKPVFGSEVDFQINKEVRSVLLTFGGSDPKNYSLFFVKLLTKNFSNLDITLILGPGYAKEEDISTYIAENEEKCNEIKIHKNVNNMIDFMKRSDLCLCSAGNTLIELLRCGVPCVVFPQTNREEKHAIEFKNRNLIEYLNLDFKEIQAINTINKLLNSYQLRFEMSDKSKKYIDGRGLERIVEIILLTS